MKKDSDSNLNHDKVTGEVVQIPLECIIPNRYQPRKTIEKESLQELIDSISTHGVLQPIVVRRDPKSSDKYEIIMGERRFRSCQALKKATIPAVVKEADDRQMMEWALIENTHRKDLNPIERAEAYKLLADTFNLTQEEVAKRVGADRTTVSHFISLLGLPQEIQEDVRNQKITTGHALALLAMPDANQRLMVWRRIKIEGLSVRDVRAIVDAYLRPRGIATNPASRFVQQYKECNAYNDPDIREAVQRLQQKFGAEVNINLFKLQGQTRSGSIYISFHDDAEYQCLLKLLDK